MTGLRWTYPDHFGQSRRLSQVFSGFLCLLLQVAAMKCSGHRVQRASGAAGIGTWIEHGRVAREAVLHGSIHGQVAREEPLPESILARSLSGRAFMDRSIKHRPRAVPLHGSIKNGGARCSAKDGSMAEHLGRGRCSRRPVGARALVYSSLFSSKKRSLGIFHAVATAMAIHSRS